MPTTPQALPTEGSRRLCAQLAYELLGPVVSQYLLKLDAHMRYATRTGAKVVFVSHAGVRIQRLYHEFLAARQLSAPENHALLWTSRCLAVKAAWSRAPDLALKVIGTQFPADDLRTVCTALLRSSGEADEALRCSSVEMRAPASQLQDFLKSGHPLAVTVVEHFRVQGALFEQYVSQMVEPARRVLLVDSGWQGTIQSLLSNALPQWDWSGVYFGKIPADWSDPQTPARATGLMFESDRFDPDLPPTAFLLYRHLIEGLFQPHGRSIEHLERHAEFGIWAPDSAELDGETPTIDGDPIYSSIRAYVRERVPLRSLTEIDQSGTSAMRDLGRIFAYPEREQALALGSLCSSAGFGRPIQVPVLIQPGDPEHGELRIRESLWPQGQIALEYPSRLVQSRQNSQLGLTGSPEELFSKLRPATHQSLPQLREDKAAVAVVVRTVNRPQFLRRALLSIGQQTFEDYICVVVCDGGDVAAVIYECTRSPVDPRRLIVIGNKISHGMEAASNLAARRVASEFIVIHDDDDSWEPEFLQRTVDFLRSPKGAPYGGVVTWATHVSEIATPDGPVIKNRRPYRTLNVVQFMEMAGQNIFAPISFLFRRKIYDRLEGFNEALPVLGDWDFNLRFLLEADIAVIRERLANYHNRDLEADPAFGNSVIVERDRHVEYEPLVRHALLRSANSSGKSAGALVALAQSERDQAARERVAQISASKSVTTLLRAISSADSACLRKHLNGSWYLQRNTDLKRAGVDPFTHWLNTGAREGRLPAFDLESLAREIVHEREAKLRDEIAELERKLDQCKREHLRSLAERERAFSEQSPGQPHLTAEAKEANVNPAVGDSKP